MRFMNSSFLMAAAFIALPMCLSAENAKPTERLRAVLQQMPAAAVSLSDALIGIFVDPNAASHAKGELPWLSGMIRPLEALAMAGPDAWGAASGIPADTIRSFLSFGQPPRDTTIWGQVPGAEEMLGPKLQELGFLPVTDSVGIYGNGEPLIVDFAKRSPGDPWRGTTGLASFIAFDNDGIIQSTTPEAVAAVLDAGKHVAEIPFLKLSLDAIDSAAGDAPVIQALLFSTASGLDAGLPAGFLTEDPKTFKDLMATLKGDIATPKSGIPPYFGGLLADARIDGKPGLLIVVSYPTCEQAEEAASGIRTLWQAEEIEGKAMADRIPGALATDHIAGHGLCAAIVTITGASDPSVQQPFDFAVAAFMRGGFPLLRIALN